MAAGGGAWKVAYADFVTAMMAFFLVMWITAQSNAVKQSIARYFEHPFDATSRSPIPSKSSSGASLIPLHREMDGIAPKASSKGKIARGGGMITDDAPPADPSKVAKSGGLRKRSGVLLRQSNDTGIGTVIQFANDSTTLDDDAKQSLNEVLPRFLGKLNKIEIRGQTPTAPTAAVDPSHENSLPDTWQLSYVRCLATMKYLESYGIAPKRILLSQSGAYDPATEDEPSKSPRESRVEIYMLGEYVDDYLGPSKSQAITKQKNTATEAGDSNEAGYSAPDAKPAAAHVD
jgi:chemotaxis protein MotB